MKRETFEDIQRETQGTLYTEEQKLEQQHVSCQNTYKTEDSAATSFCGQEKKSLIPTFYAW